GEGQWNEPMDGNWIGWSLQLDLHTADEIGRGAHSRSDIEWRRGLPGDSQCRHDRLHPGAPRRHLGQKMVFAPGWEDMPDAKDAVGAQFGMHMRKLSQVGAHNYQVHKPFVQWLKGSENLLRVLVVANDELQFRRRAGLGRFRCGVEFHLKS